MSEQEEIPRLVDHRSYPFVTGAMVGSDTPELVVFPPGSSVYPTSILKRIQELEQELADLKKVLWAHVKAGTAATNLIVELMEKRIGPTPTDTVEVE